VYFVCDDVYLLWGLPNIRSLSVSISLLSLYLCMYIEIFRKYMPYYVLENLVTVTKTNMIHKMPCGCENMVPSLLQ